MDGSIRAGGSTPPPLVPVAAAPKDQTLYESLLRYHNENDSTSTDDSSARRRRNPKVFPAGLKTSDEDEDDDVAEDRKMPAKPIVLKTPPPNSAPPSTTTNGAAVTATMATPKTQPSSRASVLHRKTFPPTDYVSPPDAPKPGIVHVSEPAIRPDSVMYIAAYGPHPSVTASVPSPPPPATGPTHSHSQPKYHDPMGVIEAREVHQQSRRESPHMGLSHSTHGGRHEHYGRLQDQIMRHNSGPPDQHLQQVGARPPDYMMNIGNDDHIGLPGQKARQRNSKSPLRIFGAKRTGAQDKDAHDSTPTGGSPANWYAKHATDRPSAHSNTRSSINSTVHSAPPAYGNPRSTAPAMPSLGYPIPTTLMRSSHDDNHSLSTAESSMDDDLRLALEISKRDTVNPPRPAQRPVPQKTQDNFRREAMDHARHASNSSLADLLLALKLSAEESGLDRRASTNLDELLAFEMSQDSRQHMTDFVAAGITTSSSSSTASTSNSNAYKSTPMKHRSSGSINTGNNNNPEEQLRILQKIREEQEQRQLEMALKASERERMQPGGKTMNHLPATTSNYLQSQQRAMEDWNQRPGGSTAASMFQNGVRSSHHQRQNSISSIDSEGRRQQLLERGTSETKHAIRSGQAHVVTCLGCSGRLQAPISYSLVYCPKCHTISPA